MVFCRLQLQLAQFHSCGGPECDQYRRYVCQIARPSTQLPSRCIQYANPENFFRPTGSAIPLRGFHRGVQTSTTQNQWGFVSHELFPSARLLVTPLNSNAPTFHSHQFLTCQNTRPHQEQHTQNLFSPTSSPFPAVPQCVPSRGSSHPAACCPSSPLTSKSSPQTHARYPTRTCHIFWHLFPTYPHLCLRRKTSAPHPSRSAQTSPHNPHAAVCESTHHPSCTCAGDRDACSRKP